MPERLEKFGKLGGSSRKELVVLPDRLSMQRRIKEYLPIGGSSRQYFGLFGELSL